MDTLITKSVSWVPESYLRGDFLEKFDVNWKNNKNIRLAVMSAGNLLKLCGTLFLIGCLLPLGNGVLMRFSVEKRCTGEPPGQFFKDLDLSWVKKTVYGFTGRAAFWLVVPFVNFRSHPFHGSTSRTEVWTIGCKTLRPACQQFPSISQSWVRCIWGSNGTWTTRCGVTGVGSSLKNAPLTRTTGTPLWAAGSHLTL